MVKVIIISYRSHYIYNNSHRNYDCNNNNNNDNINGSNNNFDDKNTYKDNNTFLKHIVIVRVMEMTIASACSSY